MLSKIAHKEKLKCHKPSKQRQYASTQRPESNVRAASDFTVCRETSKGSHVEASRSWLFTRKALSVCAFHRNKSNGQLKRCTMQ